MRTRIVYSCMPMIQNQVNRHSFPKEFFFAANLSLLQHFLIINRLGGADWVQW